MDTRRDIRNLSDVFLVLVDKMAAVPLTLPVGVEMGPQVEEDPDVVLTGRDMEMGDMDVSRDIRVLTDVCPMMFDESATGLSSLPLWLLIRKHRLMLDGRPLWRWSPSFMGEAVLRDGSILNLTVA